MTSLGPREKSRCAATAPSLRRRSASVLLGLTDSTAWRACVHAARSAGRLRPTHGRARSRGTRSRGRRAQFGRALAHEGGERLRLARALAAPKTLPASSMMWTLVERSETSNATYEPMAVLRGQDRSRSQQALRPKASADTKPAARLRHVSTYGRTLECSLSSYAVRDAERFTAKVTGALWRVSATLSPCGTLCSPPSS